MNKYILHTFLATALLLLGGSLIASANTSAAAYFCSSVYNPIARGTRSDGVVALQTLLSDGYGYNIPVTGFYGSMTTNVIRSLQADFGLSTPGNLGPQTLVQLRAVWCNGNTNTDTSTTNTNASVTLNQSSTNNGGTTLIWSSTGVSNCTLNGESVFTEGNRFVQVQGSSNYRLACQTNNGQTVEQTVTVQNNNYNNNNYNYNYLPTISLSGTMYTGGQVGICQASVVSPCNGSGYITVSTTNANYCSISGGSYNNNSISTNNSFNVSPSVPTRYTVSCTGNGGTVSESIVLTPNQNNSANGTINTNLTSYNTGNTATITWTAPSSYSGEVQGVLLELTKDGASYGTIARITNNQNAISGTYNFTIPKALIDTRNDAISCTTVNGETLCGNILRSGSYKIRATYFTPSNACFGFCQFVTNQRTLGTVESQSLNIQSSVQ